MTTVSVLFLGVVFGAVKCYTEPGIVPFWVVVSAVIPYRFALLCNGLQKGSECDNMQYV